MSSIDLSSIANISRSKTSNEAKREPILDLPLSQVKTIEIVEEDSVIEY